MSTSSEGFARIDITTIYNILTEMRMEMVQIKADLPHHIKLTSDKQSNYDVVLSDVNSRLLSIETRMTKTEERVGTLESERRPKAPWWVVISAVAVIVTTIYASITFMGLKP